MKLFATLLLVFLNLWTGALAQDTRFEQANKQYTEGNYQEAVATYEDILKSGMQSPALFYNLGNAYYKSGQLPEAILNYERALLLAPQDRDIRYNLKLAYSQTADKIEEVGTFFLAEWVQELRSSNNSDGWALYALIAFSLFLLALGLYFFSRNIGVKKLAFALALIFVIASGLSYAFAARQKERLIERTHAIVFAPSVTIKSSPDTSGNDLFVLHEGTKVKLISKIGEWWNIEMQDGSEGWIHEGDVEVI